MSEDFPERIQFEGRTWVRTRLFYSGGKPCCGLHMQPMADIIGAEYRRDDEHKG